MNYLNRNIEEIGKTSNDKSLIHHTTTSVLNEDEYTELLIKGAEKIKNAS